MSKNVVEPERSQRTVCRYVACWISKARSAQAHACARSHSTTYIHARAHAHLATCARSHTHTYTHKYIIGYLLVFHGNSGFVNAPQYYIIRTLSVCPICPNQVFINKRFDLFLMPFIRHLLIDGLFFTNVKMSGWLLNINWK